MADPIHKLSMAGFVYARNWLHTSPTTQPCMGFANKMAAGVSDNAERESGFKTFKIIKFKTAIRI